MQVFSKLDTIKQSFINKGYTVDLDFKVFKPNTVYPFEFNGEIEQTTFGSKTVRANGSYVVCVKVDNTGTLFSDLDTALDDIISVLTPLFQLLALQEFDYMYYPAQKLAFVYAKFEMRWFE